MADGDARTRFIQAAVWHGDLNPATAILAEHPELASSDIHTAAVLGDAAAVRRFLEQDPASAAAKSPPYGADALTLLSLSKYLRLDPSRSAGFLDAAEALLDAGADPNSGFWNQGEFETALYGAAGVAHHAELTRLLLERGADPNDPEVAYHAPETWGNNAALEVLVESGKLIPASLTQMLLRKLDWTDFAAVDWLLAHGADPNLGHPLQHALWRDNALEVFEILLKHGADPTLATEKVKSPFAMAAWMGRADVLDLFERRGFSVPLEGEDAFLSACSRADQPAIRRMLAADPALVARVQSRDGALLANFAGAGNTPAVRLLLDLGFAIEARTSAGGSRQDSALHVAVWHERLETVKLLLERGAPLETTNRAGQTPLALAVLAQLEVSEWTPHSTLEIVALLLNAGARVEAVRPFPTGSTEVDELLRRHGAGTLKPADSG